jgi:hypothetical protein
LSGGFSLGAFAPDEFGNPDVEVDGTPALDAVEYLIGRRPRNLTLQNLPDIVRESLSPVLRPLTELPVEPLWDVSHLKHLSHDEIMAHANHMRNLPVIKTELVPVPVRQRSLGLRLTTDVICITTHQA